MTPRGAFLSRRFGFWAAGVVLLLLLPQVFSSGVALSVMSQMGIAIVFALSYNLLLGEGGMLSFGHAVYYGLGAYVAMHTMNVIADSELPVPMVLLPLAGAAGGLLFGILFGYVSTRRAGVPFAMISLGIGELVSSAGLMFDGFFGGEEGISGDRTYGLEILGITLGPAIEVYYLIAAWLVLGTALMYAFTRTPLGRMNNAVRDNPERAEFVGYDPQRVRFYTFAISAAFAGMAGGLAAINYEIITPESLGLLQSGSVLLMAYVGGIGFFYGPIIGAIVITFMQVMLSDYTEAWLLYLGLFFIIVVMYAPGGLAGLIAMHGPVLKARLWPRLLPAYLKAGVPAAILAAGAIALIEINFHLSTSYDLDSRMTLFWLEIDPSAPLPWAAALALTVGGFWLFRRSFAAVADAWGEVHAALKSSHSGEADGASAAADGLKRERR